MSRSGDADSGEEEQEPTELSREALRMAATVRAIGAELAALLGLETRLAGMSLVAMCLLGVMVGGLLLAGWLLLQLGAVWWLRQAGVSVGYSLPALGIANLVLAWGAWLLALRKSRRLTFPNTRAAVARLQSHERTEKGD